MNHRFVNTCAAALVFTVALPAFPQEKAPTKTVKPDAKPQAAIASKTAKIGTIAVSDPKVKTAVVATDLAGAKKAAGKAGAFVGTVADIYSGKGNRVTKLNFDPDYKKAMTAVIFPASYAKLPDLQMLKGKKLLVSGKIEEFKGAYEIVVNGPDQIKMVK